MTKTTANQNTASVSENKKGEFVMNEKLELIADKMMARYYVDRRTTFEALRPEFNKKEAMVNIVLLKVFESHIEESVVPVGYNIETPHLTIENNVLVKFGKVVRMIDRFCPEMINVDFSKFNENAEIFGDRIFIVNYNGGFARKIYVANLDGKTVYDINELVDVDASVVYNADGSIKAGVYAYSGIEGGQGASASQMRKGAVTLYANQDLTHASELRNIASYGASDIILGQEMTADEAFKFGGARLNQYKSPSSMHDANVSNFAIYCDEWVDEFGNPWYDGGSFVSARFKASVFSGDKYVVAERAVIGTADQDRPYNSKTQELATEQDFVTEFINFGGNKTIFLCREDVTADDQKHFNMLFRKSTKKQSKFFGKNLVITDTHHEDLSKIDVYADLNAVKMTHDLRRASGYNLLDMAKVTDEYSVGARSSMQPLQSLFFVDPAAASAWLMKTAINHMDTALDQTMNQDASVPSLEEFKSFYAANTVQKIAPVFSIEKYAKLAHTIIDNHIKGMIRDIGKLKFYTAGAHLKIVPDMSMAFMKRFLKKGEVFSPAAEEYFISIGLDKSEWYIAMFKFPKMHPLEYGCDRVVSFAEILERIEASDLDTKKKWLLRRLFKTLSSAVIMVPAIEINKKKLAGMDYDADALEAYFDPEFVNILRKREPLAINIINDAAKQAEVEQKPFTRNVGWKVFISMIRNANKSVGEITIMNDIIVGLLIGLLQDKLEQDAAYVLGRIFEGSHCLEVYESPLNTYMDKEGHGVSVQDISDATTEDIVDRAKATALTKDNMIAILLDLATVERMLQERTIDSAKTRDKVVVPYDMTGIHLLSRSDMELRIRWGNYIDEEDYGAIDESEEIQTKGNVKFLVNTKAGLRFIQGANGEEEHYYVMDQFHEVRAELMRKLYATATKLSKIDPKFTDSEIADFKKITARADIAPVYGAIVECKNMYSDMTGIMRREIVDKSKEEIRLINDEYKRNIAELSNQVRILTPGLDPVTRTKLLIEAGRESNFAFTVCPEEFVHYVVAEQAEINFAGEKLDRCDFETGEIVSFIGGLANVKGKLARTKANLTGEFTIREYASKMFATKLITELVPVPATNTSTILFKTHASEAKNARTIIEKLNTGDVITLKPFQNNAVMLEGEQVCKFHCASNKAMANMYRNAQGVVKQVICGGTVGNNKNLRSVVIVVIENTVNLEVTEAELTASKKEREAKRLQARKAASNSFKQFIKTSDSVAF